MPADRVRLCLLPLIARTYKVRPRRFVVFQGFDDNCDFPFGELNGVLIVGREECTFPDFALCRRVFAFSVVGDVGVQE